MDGDPTRLSIRVVNSVTKVDAAAWDACALSPEAHGNPFLSYGFLKALEDSKCLGRGTGWMPQHLVAEDDAGMVLGIVPMFLKNHSQGEYVFDHGWAQAYERAGGRYYPKLQVSAPFTPVPGPRILPRPGPLAPDVFNAMVESMVKVAADNDISSIHVTFCLREQWDALGKLGFLKRQHYQFHWSNNGYKTFDDFLAALNSRKRKAIRKERAAIAKHGLTMRALSGAEITPAHWDAFFRFYMDTADRKWGSPYLNREFFHQLGGSLAEKVVLIVAERDGKPVAGALNLRGDDAIFGRNWGCIENHDFLHFETCYYQAIDYAIAHGLQRVEAGAQGEHKIQRGYLPTPTYSAHWIGDRQLRAAIANFLDRERPAAERDMAALMEYSPFRKENEKGDE